MLLLLMQKKKEVSTILSTSLFSFDRSLEAFLNSNKAVSDDETYIMLNLDHLHFFMQKIFYKK